MTAKQSVRFGAFEVNFETGELRKSGIRIGLQDQPFRVLAKLLERPGELVTRDELRQCLWSESEFGDFDQGINVAIKKIRAALGDSSDSPRYIETLARRGYRFLAPVTSISEEAAPTGSVVAPTLPANMPHYQWRYIAVIALVVIALGGWWLGRRPHSYSLGVFGPGTNFRLTPLTSSLGYEFDPQFSPDGKQIAYVWSSGKKDFPGIYVKELGVGNPVRLLPAQDGVAHFLPAWSPDGRFIACIRATKAPDLPEDPKNKASVAERITETVKSHPPDTAVYLLPAIGGEEKKLFDLYFVTDLRWSPDGKWFLMSYREKREQPTALWRFSLDGSERKQLTFPPENFVGDTNPAFSHDGKWIAFSRNLTSGGSDVFIMPTEGGEPRRLTFDAQHVKGMSFSADDSEIVFSSAREGGARKSLWRVSKNGGAPRRLPFGTDNVESPTMSRTGEHLAYVQVNQSSKIWAYDLTQRTGTPPEPTVLIGSKQLQVGPQYSPDGKRIAFTSSRTGSWEIWVSNADGSNPLQLTSFGDRQTGTPRWSPDGKLIVFDSRPDKRSDIYVVDSQGGTPRKLTSGPHDNVVPSFSRDGRWIYFSSNAGGDWDLWKTRLDGQGSPVQLTKAGGFGAFESLDGTTLYYSKWDAAGIFSMPVAGGPESLVTPDLMPRLWGGWAVTERGIYILRPGQDPETKEIYPVMSFYDFATRKTKDLRRLLRPPNPGPIIAVSPDNSTLLYAAPDEGGSEIMIVDNFR